MNLLGLNISLARKSQPAATLSIDQVIKRFEMLYETASKIHVTPENCCTSPTVRAIDTAISRRFAVMPVHVYLKTQSGGRTKKELQPNHPVERLLSNPNPWTASTSFWMDASSALVRYGNYYAYKARGNTGPIRRLIPLHSGCTTPKQDDDDVSDVHFEARFKNGRIKTYDLDEVMHARTGARDNLEGDSWIRDVREAIALEIAAEQFGAVFFGNGALPSLTLNYQEGSQGHKTQEEADQFISDFNEKFSSKRGRFTAMLLPKGVEMGTPIPVENDKAQFIQLRQLQRTIIAGAAGMPPHMVGDLSKGTYNNVEAQGGEFTTNVIVPLARVFESAMERALLTPADRAAGIIIRFNPDAILRGDFKGRQDGLAIQRQNGVINANEWREQEGMNPRSDEGGEEYYEGGPSGQLPAQARTTGGKPPADDGDEDATAA